MNLRQAQHQHERRDFKYVIIDTDVGGDDSQALITLFHLCQKFNKTLLGITTINGNAVIEDVIKNTLITEALCNTKFPVYAGNDCSLGGENIKDFYFGKDGLGMKQQKYFNLLKDRINQNLVQKQKAYKFIAEAALKYPGQVALICLGPLTNIAQAYLYQNQIIECFTSISIMGTSDTLAGLHTFYTAEFNIGLDPEASYIVFSKFKHITLVSLDTSIMSVTPQDTTEAFNQTSTQKGRFVKQIYEFQLNKNPPEYPVLCDPLAVMLLFRPELIKSGMYINVRVELKGRRTRGATIVDYFKKGNHFYNAYLVRQYDCRQVVRQILQAYKQ